ncbi:MAG TPA: hypothetical protein VMS89_01550 [Methanoregulaceae archaeon]|nr:hypothetical protein [Methanoregulaceae archaeon]
MAILMGEGQEGVKSPLIMTIRESRSVTLSGVLSYGPGEDSEGGA